ncbi:response regulator [Maribellus comscasis]|uniref:Response regulator n=1 Tax=Maribellus comscasis TaxID=2681766 RepID=A0A6I6JJ11_9BACT|nr:LytTR family DNA-binding domain-containing protein [Maribellus comscasis]QGY42845.1 response regulator [Maribellus comscasis]
MRCIVIKKPTEQINLIEFIKTVPYFDLVASCTSVFEAYEILQTQPIDLIFIDTDLSKISGLDFIKSLDDKPLFIFYSSNANLAIEGFNLNAIDFLLKPFSFDRFLKAANKALLHYTFREKKSGHEKEKESVENNGQSNEFVLVKTDYQTILVRLDNILYIEGLKDYIKIYTSQNAKPIITLNSLKRLQQNLPSEKFSRIHKSYIVGLDHIKAINKTQVVINDKYIPIGESYKNIFLNRMEELRI